MWCCMSRLQQVALLSMPAASGVAEHRLAWLQEGKIPKLEAILAESESEEEPDAVIELPANKIKLMVGAGGERIKLIQRKSKCRIQARPRTASGVTQCADGMTRKISAGLTVTCFGSVILKCFQICVLTGRVRAL